MRRILRFPSGARTEVRVGRGVLTEVGAALARFRPARVALVSDLGVPPALRRRLLASFRASGLDTFEIPIRTSEAAKRLGTIERLARVCARRGLGRDGILVALGGGVTCDLAGLLASLYLRGIPLILLPTTLLAQADAALGGKNGVDLPEGKNLLGTFHQPALVLCDIDALGSLPEGTYREGLSEILKCALLDGSRALAWMEGRAEALRRRDVRTLEGAIAMALRVKAAHVAHDERDQSGVRERLNLGHTQAHAAEAASGYRLSHGRAVAAGLVGACETASRLGVLQDGTLPERMRALLRRLGLPTAFPPGLGPRRMRQAAAQDKKARNGRVRMVLPVRAGRTVSRAVAGAGL